MNPLTRRAALQQLTLGVVAAGAAATLPRPLSAAQAAPTRSSGAGRVHQSVCRWCFAATPLETLCAEGKKMGLRSIELLQPADFPTIKLHDLACAMVSNPIADFGAIKVGPIAKAWNRKEHHDTLVAAYENQLKLTAAAGFPNVICFSGNRDGMSDEEGLENCAIGLRRILPVAEKLGVTICMELLNSKVNHKDYMCDHTPWGVELVRRLGSERFKLLYDIYHMQIMEGDVIATIRANHQFIGHYHTAGVPGRGTIDETQELYYPAIVRAIMDTGYRGFLGQEFIPKTPDPIAALADGVKICDV
jgi:hydroxypyruvate isomerase